MTPIYRPDNPVDLALAESLLTANEIPYFVHNAGFGSLYPGVQIDLYNVRTVMVPDEAAADARQALTDLLEAQAPSEPETKTNSEKLSPGQIFRMIFEFMVFGWIFPAKRRKQRGNTANVSSPDDNIP